MIPISFILLGLTAMAAQIVIIREFLSVFYGNEASIGFILGAWLLGGGMGSLFLGRFADRIKNRASIFAFCQITLSALLPLSILLVRSVKGIFNIGAYEIIPIPLMAISSLIILVPLCSMFGFMFALGCRLYENIGMVYGLEAIGSMLGGLISSVFLIQWFSSFEIMGILSLLNIMAGFFLLNLTPVSICFFPLFVAIFLLGAKDVEKYSLKRQFKGYKVIASKNSLYGNITLIKRENQVSLFYNGLYLYSLPDELRAEEACHFCLLSHPSPQNVLLVGGGIAGLLQEILKHPIKHVDYLELDPLLVKIAYKPLKDKRVYIKNLDGRFFIKNTHSKYDCVIIHLGNPCTAQLNRYYTIEFFKEVKRVLNPSGILSFSLSSSENYISPELQELLTSIYLSLKDVFLDVKIIPGEIAYFLACNKKRILTYDYQVLEERIKERRLNVKYVREYYLSSKMSRERIARIEKAVKKNSVKKNYDFKPISYYYDTIFFSSRFGKSFLKLNEERILKLTVIFLFFIALFSLFKRRGIVLFSVASAGFSEMCFQILLLISFQIIYGYLFYKLSFIFSFFMLGLTAGSFWMTKVISKIKKDILILILIRVGFCLYPLVFLFFLSQRQNLLFSPIIAGFLNGFQFPLANKIYLKSQENIGRIAGLNYAMELFGSCLGAVLTGTFLIPLLGIHKTSLLISLINLVVLFLLMSIKILDRNKA